MPQEVSRLFELDGGDGLFTGKPVNRKNGGIQDCIHSYSLIKQLIDRNLKTMHCRNGLKPVPLSVSMETARIMKSSYDSPGKKSYVTGYNLSPLLSLPVNQDRLFRRPT